MSEREIQQLIHSGSRHVSLDAPLPGAEEGDATMLDVMVPENNDDPDFKLMAESLREEVAQGLYALSPRETEIIGAYYGLNGRTALTLDEISELYGLTRERVRQIKERGIRRLRKIHSEQLKSYLG
jgi:RNA polymerase primary sigma factor